MGNKLVQFFCKIWYVGCNKSSKFHFHEWATALSTFTQSYCIYGSPEKKLIGNTKYRPTFFIYGFYLEVQTSMIKRAQPLAGRNDVCQGALCSVQGYLQCGNSTDLTAGIQLVSQETEERAVPRRASVAMETIRHTPLPAAPSLQGLRQPQPPSASSPALTHVMTRFYWERRCRSGSKHTTQLPETTLDTTFKFYL